MAFGNTNRKSTLPMALLNSLCQPAREGNQLFPELVPLVGTRCVTGSEVSIPCSPCVIRSIHRWISS